MKIAQHIFEILVSGGVFAAIINKLPRFQRKRETPQKTLRFVLQPRGAWWHMGAMGQDKKPAMQVVGEWYVTNLASEPIVVTTAYIKRPRTEAILPLLRHPQRNVYGGYPVNPKGTTKLTLDFWVQPTKRKANEDFKARVVVQDQFGNKHKLGKVTFKYR